MTEKRNSDKTDETKSTQNKSQQTDPGETKPRRGARPCPICSKMSMERYHPFCSRRCADIDLHRWLGGNYAIPAEEPPETLDGPPLPRSDEPE